MDARSSSLPSSAFVHLQCSISHHGQRNGYLHRSMYIRCCVPRRLERGYGLLPYGQGMRVLQYNRKAIDTERACTDQSRHRRTSFLSSSSRNDYIAYSFCDSSTTASLFWLCSPLYISTSGGSTPLEVLRIHSASGLK